jgi:polysaccharide export outer membrane protein
MILAADNIRRGRIPSLFGWIAVVLALATPLAAQDDAYRMGPRDVLGLTIFAGGERQVGLDVTVSDDGTINVPFIGPVEAAGRTPTELENRIYEPLAADYFVQPEVNVQIKGYHSLRYYIAGAVSNPGLYETTSRASLMKLIAKAGGVLPERGKTAYILRDGADAVAEVAAEAANAGEAAQNLATGNAQIRVHLDQLLDEGDMSQNIPLEPGDLVYVSLERAQDVAEYKIYVEGEVRNPGVYSHQPGLTALNAILTAGGFDRYAAPGRTRIIRKTNGKQHVIRIDLDRVREGEIQDVQLQPGDLVNVPESWF